MNLYVYTITLTANEHGVYTAKAEKKTVEVIKTEKLFEIIGKNPLSDFGGYPHSKRFQFKELNRLWGSKEHFFMVSESENKQEDFITLVKEHKTYEREQRMKAVEKEVKMIKAINNLLGEPILDASIFAA